MLIKSMRLEKMKDLQRKEAAELFILWNEKGLPQDFKEDFITIDFNANSGMVFLTNSDCQVAINVDGQLESFYTTPYVNYEGTYNQLKKRYINSDYIWDIEDAEYLYYLANLNNDNDFSRQIVRDYKLNINDYI